MQAMLHYIHKMAVLTSVTQHTLSTVQWLLQVLTSMSVQFTWLTSEMWLMFVTVHMADIWNVVDVCYSSHG